MTIFQVMQRIERNENHDEKINREDPNWSLVYKYLAALLSADELPELGQIGVYTPHCNENNVNMNMNISMNTTSMVS